MSMKVSTTVLKSKKLIEGAFEFGTKIKELEELLNRCFLEREDVVSGIIAALLTRHHMLVVGLHGTAKSALFTMLFKAFEESRIFSTQCTKFMTEDALFGIANIKKMQEEGVIEYNVEGMLPTADFAYLDEFMDSNDPCLRSTLDILNERVFRRGRQFIQCPLRTAVATTNFMVESDQLAAVLDRFLIKMKVSPLEAPDSVVSMLEGYLEQQKNEVQVPGLTLQELDNFHAAMRFVTIGDDALEVYRELMDEYVRETAGKIYISDRRKCWGLELAKMTALTAERDVVSPEDFAATEMSLTYGGNDMETKAFDKAYRAKIGNLEKNREYKSKVTVVRNALEKINTKVNTANEMQLIELAKSTKQIINTLDKRDRGMDGDMPEIGKEFDNLLARAKETLQNITQITVAKLK